MPPMTPLPSTPSTPSVPPSPSLGVARPDQAAYMLRAAERDAGRAYKARLLDLLDVRAGHTVLDLGCGPGTDLPALAERAGAEGTVIAVDRDPDMLARARERTAGLAGVELRAGDAHDLPVGAGSVDRARTDRMLMHVADPAQVLAELHRVARPGARIGLAEPDWDTLIVDSDDLETSRAFTGYTTAVAVRNATVGRSLPRLAARAGFRVETVFTETPHFEDAEEADYALGLGRNMERAIAEGRVTQERGRRWFAGLSEGPFFASFTLVAVVCVR
ncbi:methyltransferase domain-containing protein [Streptomyces sp. NPDC004610]|uniref:methyltransferase domain-containing protein n=1 Tax=unclassified Streptomyces TaxID=2593676 RepID=UPI0033B75B41